MALNNSINNLSSNTMSVIQLSGIDGKTTGAIKIGTTSNIGRFVPLFVNVEGTNISGFVTVASFSVGSNGASYNNILAISAMTGVIATNIVLQTNAAALLSSLPASTDVYINITTGAVGTTYTMRASVIGFYF